jgi:hypothetical protein
MIDMDQSLFWFVILGTGISNNFNKDCCEAD